MDARRLELYELLKPTLGEDPARALVIALGPSPDQVATKKDLELLDQRFEARIERLENVLTRRMIAILGTWTVAVASAFGWAGALLR